MLHFQYAVLGFLILVVESQHTEADDVPKALPEEFVLDLYENYKEAVGDAHGENLYVLLKSLVLYKSILVKS